MDAATIARLNQINREFYRVTADEFDQTRGEAWPGWDRLLPYLKTPLSVLDVGCGNGRFGVFLQKHLVSGSSPRHDAAAEGLWAGVVHYHGLDSNPALLERARTSLANLLGMELSLEEHDVVEQPPDAGEYDLVAAFGLLHHIPGDTERQTFMRRLADCVKPGGLLAFACWRFYEYERFRERIVPWSEDITVEPGDYLLDWRRGTVSLRYCHYVDDAEHAALIAATGLGKILTYRADGQTGDANRYSVLRKK
jgi:SAM-dependent methyltransferase